VNFTARQCSAVHDAQRSEYTSYYIVLLQQLYLQHLAIICASAFQRMKTNANLGACQNFGGIPPSASVQMPLTSTKSELFVGAGARAPKYCLVARILYAGLKLTNAFPSSLPASFPSLSLYPASLSISVYLSIYLLHVLTTIQLTSSSDLWYFTLTSHVSLSFISLLSPSVSTSLFHVRLRTQHHLALSLPHHSCAGWTQVAQLKEAVTKMNWSS